MRSVSLQPLNKLFSPMQISGFLKIAANLLNVKQFVENMEKREVYLDNSATTRVDDRVIEEMTKHMREIYANPHSSHEFGFRAEEAMENARKIVGKALNARTEEIIFTSGGTESDNLALIGTFESQKDYGKKIITDKIEHPAVLNACRYLKSFHGANVVEFDVDDKGLVDPNKILESLDKETILVSIMTANNEIGTIQRIREIGKLIHDRNEDSGSKTLFHTDAVQAFTKVDIDVNRDYIDMLSISGHKFHGPKGIGVLYLKNQGQNVDGPFIFPTTHGGNQENGLRSGTSNVPGIVGLAKAVQLVLEHPEEKERIKTLRDRLIQKLFENIPKMRLTGHPEQRLISHVSFLVPDVSGERMLNMLSSNRIYVSTGSACSAKSKSVSYVLKALKIPEPDIFGSMRWTLGRFNTEEEIDYAVDVFKRIVEKLRSMGKT